MPSCAKRGRNNAFSNKRAAFLHARRSRVRHVDHRAAAACPFHRDTRRFTSAAATLPEQSTATRHEVTAMNNETTWPKPTVSTYLPGHARWETHISHTIAGFCLALICLMLHSPIQAAQPGQNDAACAKDPTLCRALAFEIAKADLNEYIQREVEAKLGRYTLCPGGGSDCCPIENMTRCLRAQKLTVERIRQGRYLPAPSSKSSCPLPKEMCDRIGPSLCDADETWSPWGGCRPESITGITGIDIPIPHHPPPPCACGQRWNGKICAPCILFGVGIACPLSRACLKNEELYETMPNSSSGLSRRTADHDVQLEAIRSVKTRLQAALKALEAHAEELEHMQKPAAAH